MEPVDPPRKTYELKERAFERVNTSTKPSPPPTAVVTGARPGQVAASSHPGAVDPNDIHSILQHNRAVEQRHGKDVVKFASTGPRRSRRKRDFWLLLVGGILLVVALVALGNANPVSVIFGLAGMVVISLGLTWIMWFVMGDY